MMGLNTQADLDFDDSQLPYERKGVLWPLILRSLSEGPQHGYAIARRIRTEIGEFWRPSLSAIYKSLEKLEEADFVFSTNEIERGRNRKRYCLTEKGERLVEKQLKIQEGYLEKMLTTLQAETPALLPLMKLVSTTPSDDPDQLRTRLQLLEKALALLSAEAERIRNKLALLGQ